MALQQNQPVVEGAVAAPAISYRPDLTPVAYFDAKGDQDQFLSVGRSG